MNKWKTVHRPPALPPSLLNWKTLPQRHHLRHLHLPNLNQSPDLRSMPSSNSNRCLPTEVKPFLHSSHTIWPVYHNNNNHHLHHSSNRPFLLHPRSTFVTSSRRCDFHLILTYKIIPQFVRSTFLILLKMVPLLPLPSVYVRSTAEFNGKRDIWKGCVGTSARR